MQIDDIKHTLKAMLVDRLSLTIEASDIADDKPLFKQENGDVPGGLDLDSVEALEIIVGIEEQFDVTVEEGDYADEFYSINTVADFVQGLLAAKAA